MHARRKSRDSPLELAGGNHGAQQNMTRSAMSLITLSSSIWSALAYLLQFRSPSTTSSMCAVANI
eukprot:5408958-Amphidinium_carterae.1